MSIDKEGFWYPCVDKNVCVDCGLCETVCPQLNDGEEREPLSVYAVKHPVKEIQLKSSSGGAFTLFSEWIIKHGGIVFGAMFNEKWDVVHGFSDTIEGLEKLRMSKYVQSDIRTTFKEAEQFLKDGQKVMFVGTPCQIHGLKLYLRKEYDNLLTVDFVCHGVPSPSVWKEYLKAEVAHMCEKKSVPLKSKSSLSEQNVHITDIQFRNKKFGWEKFSFSLILTLPSWHGKQNSVSLSKDLHKDEYLRGFIHDIYLRPSCYTCRNKCFKSGSDITLADFWGIKNTYPHLYDSNGVSCVTINTDHGKNIFSELHIQCVQVNYDKVLLYNPSFEKSVRMHRFRKFFFKTRKLIPLNRLVLGIQVVNKLCKVVDLKR